ncbi:hypothetical protein ACFL6X_06695 [Candidatus Latescibacterota bacterium]
MIRRPGLFLACFAVSAALLLVAWSHLSGHYLAALIWVVNSALNLSGTPLSLPLPQLSGNEMVYPGLAGGVALFVATPRSLRWKARWLAVLLVALCLLHASQLYLGAWMAVAQNAARLQGVETSSAVGLLSYLGELSETWGTVAGVLLLWFMAIGGLGDHRVADPD